MSSGKPAFNKVFVHPSASWSDGFNPTGQGRSLKIAMPEGGERDRWLDKPQQLPGPTGDYAYQENPFWRWTDWTSVPEFNADSKTGKYVVMLRAFSEKAADVLFANGQFEGMRDGSAMEGGFQCWTGGVNNGWDLTDFRYLEPGAFKVNNPVNGTPLVCVQFLSPVGAAVAFTVGDSHQSGSGTSGQLNNFTLQSIVELERSEGLPKFTVVNDAFGGASSTEYITRSRQRIIDTMPSVVALPSWSFNDYVHAPSILWPEIQKRFRAEIVALMEVVQKIGATPILLSPFPRDPKFMSGTMLEVWLAQREWAMADFPTELNRIDAALMLSQKRVGTRLELTGTYQQGLSDDDVHPNDAGHRLLSKSLSKILLNIA